MGRAARQTVEQAELPDDIRNVYGDEIDCPHHHYTYDAHTGGNRYPKRVFPPEGVETGERPGPATGRSSRKLVPLGFEMPAERRNHGGGWAHERGEARGTRADRR